MSNEWHQLDVDGVWLSQSQYDDHVDCADIVHVTDTDETDVTYVDGEYFDNHDYDDDTGDDTW